MSKEQGYVAEGAFFKALAQKGGHNSILFGKFEVKVKVLELFKIEEPLDFYQPDAKVVSMMKNMGYNFQNKIPLNFGK